MSEQDLVVETPTSSLRWRWRVGLMVRELSRSEVAVVTALAMGQERVVLAGARRVSTKTIATQRRSALDKVGVRTVSEFVGHALARGWLLVEDL